MFQPPSNSRPLSLPDNLHTIIVAEFLSNLGKGPRDSYQASMLLSKFANPSPAAAKLRREAAIAKWLRVEEHNRKTNIRLATDAGDFRIGRHSCEYILKCTRDLIATIVGDEVPLEELQGSFSSGASTSKRRSPGTVARKYSEKPDVASHSWDTIWPMLYRESPIWSTINGSITDPRFVEGNVMFTVPKNDDIDRVACKEPDLNMYYQKAVGDFLRLRLRRFGIDLNDQSRNRELARQGSLNRDLCTIDLSSASDTVTTQLVCRLLPVDWFVTLDRLRSRVTRVPEGRSFFLHENEMFSSMGNGFTFELESLIFFALVKTICRLYRLPGVVSVYGDDIIAPSRAYGIIRTVFSFCGFMINDKKSFFRGPFRESCGGHYHDGVDITPIFVRKPLSHLTDLILFLNAVRRWGSNGSSWVREDLWDFWRKYASYVPRRLHGGWDTESRETLASREGPADRLVLLTNRSTPTWAHPGTYLSVMSHDPKQPISPYSTRDFKLGRAWSVERTGGRFVFRKGRKHFGYHFGKYAPAFAGEYISPDQ